MLSPSRPASQIDIKERLIIALDVPNAAQAQRLVQAVGDSGVFYKVGLELFTAEGPAFVNELVQSGKKVFLDLKIHEIPNSAAGAVRSAAALGVSMVTVHASGGSKMLRAAAEASASTQQAPIVLGVTVLTSLADSELQELGFKSNADEQVIRLANLAKSAGCGGVVASPQEASLLRKSLGRAMAIVTPGIRPAGSDIADQQRIATPSEALRSGASHIVVGRPISAAPDPALAAKSIIEEMRTAE
jgi:orotidine-5'-phosphate decarboxylase